MGNRLMLNIKTGLFHVFEIRAQLIKSSLYYLLHL